MVAGSGGETRFLQRQPDGILKYSDDEIEGFDHVIFTTLQLANGYILVTGGKGETRLLQLRFTRQAQDIRDRAEEILG